MMEVPSGGFTARFPDGHTVNANHPSLFLRLCYEHLERNGGDTSGGWQQRMLNLICETNPELPCVDIEQPTERPVTGADVWHFFNALKEAVTNGAEAVSEEEQDRRIGICLRCPKLTHTACSFGCGQLAAIISDLTLGRKSRNIIEAHKANCGVCSCEISTLTAWPLEILQEVDAKTKFHEGEFPEQCWRVASSPAIS